MRVLSVSVGQRNDGADWWRILNLERLLVESGHEVDSVSYHNERFQVSPLPCAHPDCSRQFPTKRLGVHLTHLEVLKGREYDVVIGNNHAATLSSLLGKFLGIPLVFDAHADLAQETRLKSDSPAHFRLRMYIEFARDLAMDTLNVHFADEILCVSRHMTRAFAARSTCPGKVHYVPNGVDLEWVRSAPVEEVERLKRVLEARGHFVFGYVGGIQSWQGIENLFLATKHVTDPRALFVFLGPGAGFRGRNLKSIPAAPRSEVPAYYALCDVLILPRPDHAATRVAAPTKFAEYAGSGRPVLTTNVGDPADLVKRYKCGVVVDTNTPKDLSLGIDRFMSLSEGELDSMGRNARILAEREFDWRKIGPRLDGAVRAAKD